MTVAMQTPISVPSCVVVHVFAPLPCDFQVVQLARRRPTRCAMATQGPATQIQADASWINPDVDCAAASCVAGQ